MQSLIKSLLLSLLLVSCGTDSRYRDISQLERPPTLPSSGSPSAASTETTATQAPTESYAPDESRIEKKSGKIGLGDVVSLTDASPPQIKIKQPLDKAWNTVERGLKQSEIKITDHERNKAQYHVIYAPSSVFSFMKMDPKTIYLLTLTEEGNETTVSAALAPEPNSSASDKDNDNTIQLLHLLFDTLHDDLKEE
jgi:uncharacterized lipoprotein